MRFPTFLGVCACLQGSAAFLAGWSVLPGAQTRGGQPYFMNAAPGSEAGTAPTNVAAVIVAGGVGSRMKADRPKQFLELRGKPILTYSLELLLSMTSVRKLILVIDQQYRGMFAALAEREPRLVFADPGKERQDSVWSGLQQVPSDAELVAVHDAARPLVTVESIEQVFADAWEHGAAVLAVPVKATVKESGDGRFVLRTIDRSRLWEIQTPQVVKPELLRKGFEKVRAENLAVTDDASIIEQLGLPVALTLSEYTNLKITTPEDLVIAEQILRQREAAAAAAGVAVPAAAAARA